MWQLSPAHFRSGLIVRDHGTESTWNAMLAMQLVEAPFMNAEEKPSIPGYVPAVLLFDDARKFIHRDEPDYWENF